jgi:hypothetical protein
VGLHKGDVAQGAPKPNAAGHGERAVSVIQ